MVAGEPFLPLCNIKYSKTRGDCGCVNCLLVIIGIAGRSGDLALLLPPMYSILTHSLAELHGFQQQHDNSFKWRFICLMLRDRLRSIQALANKCSIALEAGGSKGRRI